MEQHASGLSKFLTLLLHLPRHPWPNFAHGEALSFLERYDPLLNATLAFLVSVILMWVVRKKLVRIPGPLQQTMEAFMGGIRGLASDNIDHHAERYVPLIGTLAVFIFLNNLFGLIPGLSPATGSWNVTLACALVVFFYYNFQGMKEQGIGKYWGHFAGPVMFLAPLMFPLEVLGLFARILSHSLRLFGNMAGEHVVSGIFFTLVPVFVPVPLMFFGIFTCLIQTFVFVMLTTIYISGAVAHEH